jgi:outer membrane protein assembly factor BamB
MRCNRIPLALLVFVATSHFLRADNWPAWRGPNGNGECAEKNLPTKWSPTENIVWKVALPDQGNSTPIIWKDRLFLTQATEKGKKRSTICFNIKEGSKRWEKTVEYTEDEPTHNTNPHCSASPVTDGEIVVVSHGSAGVFCYDLDGKELWKRDLGKCIHIWGNASSPVIWQDRVFLNFGPGNPTFLIAMNKKDGADIWKKDIPGGKSGLGKEKDWLGSWSTPTLAKIQGREELVVSWPEAVRSYDPKTGAELWSCKGLTKLVYTSALVSDQYVVAMSGYGGAAIGLKAGGQGDVTESNRLWQHAKANPQRIGTGVFLGEQHIYMVNAPGDAMYIEAKTGEILWKERASGEQWSSLVHADGKLYFTTLQGETVVLAAKPKFEEVARNKLGERTLSSIAVADERLYIRTYKNLWCIGK